MKAIDEKALEELHSRLMAAVRSDIDMLGTELQRVIGQLGSYTQEVLLNAHEPGGLRETALSVACRRGKTCTVEELLELQAVPTMTVYRRLMTNAAPRSRVEIAKTLLRCTQPQLRQSVFWLACLYNEVEIVSYCLRKLQLDANVAIVLDTDRELLDSWPFPEAPLPVQYAAHRNYQMMVGVLEGFTDDDRAAASEFYVDHLLIAAYRGHRTLAEQILKRRRATVEQVARIYEVIGATDIIANSPAVGKCMWKRAIAIVEAAGGHKSRTTTDIICLEPHIQEFRTQKEIEVMRAKELRIQAINIMRKNLGSSYLFIDALLRRDYSKKISVFALDVILDTDNLTAASLSRVQSSLEVLGFFLFPDLALVTQCLQWCVRAAGHLRSLLDIRPVCINDLSRFRTLVEFACQILLSVELVEARSDDDMNAGIDVAATNDAGRQELNHVLRRVVGVFQPLNNVSCLLDRLYKAKKNRPFTDRNIFQILMHVGADLRVTDAFGNVVADYTTERVTPESDCPD